MTKELPKDSKDIIFSDLLIFDPQISQGSIKFTKVSEELNSRLIAALTLLSDIKWAIYFGGVCPSAA